MLDKCSFIWYVRKKRTRKNNEHRDLCMEKIKKILEDFLINDKTGIKYKIKGNSIQLIINGQNIFYDYEVHNNITRPIVSLILNKSYDNNLLLASNYINPVISKELKDNNINFIDTAGNCYISSDIYLTHHSLICLLFYLIPVLYD